MACSCNRNNRGSNNFGCRRYAQNTRWPSSGYGYYTNSQTGCGYSGSCNTYGCNSGSCNSCECGSNTCGCNSGSCNPCGCSPTPYNSCGSSAYNPGRYSADGHHRRRPPWRPPFDWEDDCGPFYCGPCGPVNPVCGCNDSCPDNCGCCCHAPAPCGCQIYGSFQQNGSLVLDEGGAIPFSGASTSNGIFQEDGELTVDAAGVYMVTLSVTVPANTTLSTLLTIRLNGNTVSGGTLTIDKTTTDAPLQTSAQVIVSACAGDRITVNTSQALNLTADSAGGQIAALTILRIA